MKERISHPFLPFLMNPDYCLITNEDEQRRETEVQAAPPG